MDNIIDYCVNVANVKKGKYMSDYKLWVSVFNNLKPLSEIELKLLGETNGNN